MNVNTITLVGRVVKDPELKVTTSGQQVASFTIATNDKYKNKDGKVVEETEFSNCVTFGKLAETISKFIVKGQELYVVGKKKTREWMDKEDKKHYMVNIVVSTAQFGSKPAGNSKQSSSESFKDESEEEMPVLNSEDIDVKDIPF